MRLSAGRFLALGAFLGLLVVFSTDQIVPATSAYQAQMRIWLAARASGVTAYLLLTVQVLLGLVLSHPENQTTWKLSKRLFPWHENLLVFILAFLAAHIVSIVLDPFAGVGVGGALVPGLSSYRSVPVALGTLGLYALLATGLTARYTKLLPPGAWLTLHRLAAAVFVLAWLHGTLTGSDSAALQPMYLATGALVLTAASYRYWIVRRARVAHARPDPTARVGASVATTGKAGPASEPARALAGARLAVPSGGAAASAVQPKTAAPPTTAGGDA